MTHCEFDFPPRRHEQSVPNVLTVSMSMTKATTRMFCACWKHVRCAVSNAIISFGLGASSSYWRISRDILAFRSRHSDITRQIVDAANIPLFGVVDELSLHRPACWADKQNDTICKNYMCIRRVHQIEAVTTICYRPTRQTFCVAVFTLSLSLTRTQTARPPMIDRSICASVERQTQR